MGLFDLFKDKKDDSLDPLKDLVLSKLKPGYMVDYDMKTWQVTGINSYDFGEGYTSDEWELTTAGETWYLERYEDDETEWSLTKKIPIGAIEGNITKHILEQEDPPNKIEYKGEIYYLDESGAAYFLKDAKEPRQEFIYWTFLDEKEEKLVSIEQWGEKDFEASAGIYVEEYQFTNILPGESGNDA
jgi:hypothetical protein